MKMKKLENVIRESAKRIPDLKGNWFLVDDGFTDTEGTILDNNKEQKITLANKKLYKYEVYRELLFNNFIIVSYEASIYKNGNDISDYDDFFMTINGLDEISYNYLINALNSNQSTIVHCYENNGESTHCDIYYDAWDIENFDKYYSGSNSLSYLRSRMKADGLQECEYKYRDIRKGIVYPSAFLWENMEQTNPEEYKTHVTDKGVSGLIKQCDAEQLNRKSIGE